jgi:hypothetical protein
MRSSFQGKKSNTQSIEWHRLPCRLIWGHCTVYILEYLLNWLAYCMDWRQSRKVSMAGRNRDIFDAPPLEHSRTDVKRAVSLLASALVHALFQPLLSVPIDSIRPYSIAHLLYPFVT